MRAKRAASDQRHPAGVLAREARPPVPGLVQLDRLVAAPVEACARVLPGPDPGAVVGHVAVGSGERLAALGGDQHRPVEGRPVADRPGRQHHDERRDHGRGHAPAARPPPHQRDQQQRQQQQRLAAGQRGQAQQRAQHGGHPDAGAVEQAIGDHHRERREQPVGRLGHHRAVGRDQDRVERAEAGCDQAGALAGEPAAQQAERDDRAAACEQADQPSVPARHAELVEPGHERREQRRSLRGGDRDVVAEELGRAHEAVAARDQVGEGAVVGLVVEDAGRPGGDEQRLEGSQADADRDDPEQPERVETGQAQTFQGAPPAAQMSFSRTASL